MNDPNKSAVDHTGGERKPIPEPSPGSAGTFSLIEQIRGVGPVVTVMTVMAACLPAILGFAVIYKSAFVPETVKPWIEANVQIAPFIFAAAFALGTGSALLPTYAMSFAAGVFFGWRDGAIVALAGITAGALVGFFWGATLARKRVRKQIARYERAEIIRSALVDRPFGQSVGAIALLRFPPNSPFAMTNLVLSSTGVGLGAFLAGTALGMAPRTLIAVFFGVGVDSVAEARSLRASWVWWAGAGTLLIVVVVLYRVFSKWANEALQRHAGMSPGQKPPESPISDPPTSP